MTGIPCSWIIARHKHEFFGNKFDVGTLRNSVYDSGVVADRIGVAFGIYNSSEGLVVTIRELLSSEFHLNDLCVVGPVDSLSDSLKLLEEQSPEDLDQLPLFARTENFFGNDDIGCGVGSIGRSLDILKSLMERGHTSGDESREHQYHINFLEVKKQIAAGNLTLFVCTGALDLLVLALRILIKRSSSKVQSHEFRH